MNEYVTPGIGVHKDRSGIGIPLRMKLCNVYPEDKRDGKQC